MKLVSNGRKLRVIKWFGTRKEGACVRSICTHVINLIIGVTQGYRYKMKLVYAHFPINATVTGDKKEIQIRNFLGEKVVRKVISGEGVVIESGDALPKDEIWIEGNDIDEVSQTAASIHTSCTVKRKDVRKFLDGIYVSAKGQRDAEKPI